MSRPKFSPIELERRKGEEEETRLFLEDFERKLNFTPSFIEKKEVSVDFFNNHILPHVVVLEVSEGQSEIGIYLYFETVHEDDCTNLNKIRMERIVTFMGIGFNFEDHRWDKLNTLKYCCFAGQGWYYQPSKRSVSTISDSEVITALQSQQQYVAERMKIVDMTLKEIKEIMSGPFLAAWIDTLISTIDLVYEEWELTRGLVEFFEHVRDYYHKTNMFRIDIPIKYQHEVRERRDYLKGAECASVVLYRRLRNDVKTFPDVERFLSKLEQEINYLK